MYIQTKLSSFNYTHTMTKRILRRFVLNYRTLSKSLPLFFVAVKVLMQFYSTVTAACPYPALRLDKLYAALIRCLVLWTVTKQFLVSCFKGLYLCIELNWIRCDPAHTSLTVSSRAPALQL